MPFRSDVFYIIFALQMFKKQNANIVSFSFVAGSVLGSFSVLPPVAIRSLVSKIAVADVGQ